ncbi:unnamed protein product [Caenorhabditis bovis]|uniref:Zinc finger CCCH domain-containing protein 14 n=1 Tax=Caenorhabditis bovis TaxID=2654633 RepID=A0A8S1EB36_9PELO|nr:unnamed protein product [Caenorhabditis bovis]
MSSQSGTSEVKKKLKAAIRAKLEELGVYVDDELPDYIMVMIANKKEQKQMKEDLALFIGKNTNKFVDWLFELFNRLESASGKQPEKSSQPVKNKEDEEKRKKEEEQKKKDAEKKKISEEKSRREREERDKEREKERERERAKQRNEKEKEKEKHRKHEKEESRHRRSRSKTWSDEEPVKPRRRSSERRKDHQPRSHEKKKVASTVVHKAQSISPEPLKVQSTVVVKRNVRPSGDNATMKARSSMFLKAMNEASVSAGYGSIKKKSAEENEGEEMDDDMSDIDALPSKKAKLNVKERLAYKRPRNVTPQKEEEDDTVVLNNAKQGGPQMIVTLAGGKEAIKKLRVHDRIVVADKSNLNRKQLKRKIADGENSDQPKSKHERIIFDLTPPRDEAEPDVLTLKKWDGQIQIGESDSSDEEAHIDAILAETRVTSNDNMEKLPPMRQLSGINYTLHTDANVPAYVPTPISVLNDQKNMVNMYNPAEPPAFTPKEEAVSRERCHFWPNCKKDPCQYYHPVKACTNFPNCSFGNRCHFIHPPCRFDALCTKLAASLEAKKAAAVKTEVKQEVETSTAASSSSPADANTKENGKKMDSPVKKTEASAAPASATLAVPAASGPTPQSSIFCRFAGGCKNAACPFKHPKECKFGANCRNTGCYFYHKPTATAVPTSSIVNTKKYKWTATA